MADDEDFLVSLSAEQKERLRALADAPEVRQRTSRWKQVLAWILSSIGFLSLIDDLGWVTLKGYASEWLDAYQRTVQRAFDFLFGWVDSRLFDVTHSEAHILVLWMVVYGAGLRAYLGLFEGEEARWKADIYGGLLAGAMGAAAAILLPDVATMVVLLGPVSWLVFWSCAAILRPPADDSEYEPMVAMQRARRGVIATATIAAALVAADKTFLQ